MSDTHDIHSRWQPYPAYKDSGIAWLGDIPAHWETAKIRYLLRSKNGAIRTGPFGSQLLSKDMNESDIKVYNQQNVITGNLNIGDEYISLEKYRELQSFTVFPGDILVTTRGTIGKSVIVPEEAEKGILHPCLMRIQADEDKIVLRFLQLLIQESDFVHAQFMALSDATTIEVIYSGTMQQVIVPLPTLTEQEAILGFLDDETARIDDLIAAKQTFIERLHEKRSALISHTVTRGLNPDAPMKDSGLEWLGEIPAHWGVWKIAHAFGEISSGTTPKTDQEDYYDGDIPWVTTSELREKIIHSTKQTISESALKHYSALKLFPKGTLLIAMYGATIGRLGILGIEASTNQACCALAYPRALQTRFTYYWFIAFRDVIVALSSGGGQPNINQEKIKSIRISTPPLDEQRAIAAYLDNETARIDNLIATTEATIQRLEEYRTALISTAVTGRIDVRG